MLTHVLRDVMAPPRLVRRHAHHRNGACAFEKLVQLWVREDHGALLHERNVLLCRECRWSVQRRGVGDGGQPPVSDAPVMDFLQTSRRQSDGRSLSEKLQCCVQRGSGRKWSNGARQILFGQFLTRRAQGDGYMRIAWGG